MKKIIYGTVLTAGLLLSSACGGGDHGQVNKDTVISSELTDSISRACGAFRGVNLQDEISYSDKIDDFIEGYQLVVGHEYTREKLMGIRAGMLDADRFMYMSAQGLDINRDLYLQEFRKYLQKQNLSPEEYKALYDEFQQLMEQVDQIIMKREQMRMQDNPNAPETGVVEEEVVVEEPITPQDIDEESPLVSAEIVEAIDQTL